MTSSTSRSVSPCAPRCRSSRTIGRIAPRYCTTSRLPTFSTASVRTCSRRGALARGVATRGPPPARAAPADGREQHPLALGLGRRRLADGGPRLLPVGGLGPQRAPRERLDIED